MPVVMRNFLFPASLIFFFSLGIFAANKGVDRATYAIFVYSCLLIFGLWLELKFPYAANVLSNTRIKTDVLVLIFNFAFVAKLTQVLLMGGLVWVADNYFNTMNWGPIWLQTITIIVMIEFLRYWIHRWQHRIPLLWKWHAVHHSIPVTYGMNGIYAHPIDFLLRNVLPLLVPTMLGFDAVALFLATVVLATTAYFAHCNMPLNYGPLEWLFVSPRLHRWHHSEIIKESDNNFGVGFILFDRIFNTICDPAGRPHPEKMGIEGVKVEEKSVKDLFIKTITNVT